MSEQRSLEDACEGQRLFALEMIGEAGADQFAAIEERLDPRSYEILGTSGRLVERGGGNDRRTP